MNGTAPTAAQTLRGLDYAEAVPLEGAVNAGEALGPAATSVRLKDDQAAAAGEFLTSCPLSSAMPEDKLPDVISCSAIVNYVLASVTRCHAGFPEFLRRSLTRPVHSPDSFSADVWPCPPPCWRWTGSAALSPKRRRKRRWLEVRAKTLQQVVCALNWLSLGHCKSPPSHARIGCPISPQQHVMLENLEQLISHFLAAPDIGRAELGRAGEKLAKICGAAIQLPSVSFDETDVGSFLKDIQHTVDPYGQSSSSKDPAGREQSCDSGNGSTVRAQQQTPESCSVSVPASGSVQLGDPVHLNISPAKPVVADRIKWKLGPSFDPTPFLSDPVVKKAYKDPNVLRKPEHEWPVRRRAKVHCSREELIRLATKWDALGACRLVPTSHIDPAEAVGLFAVNKDQDFDRLIINPTVINSRCYGCNSFTKTLAPGHLAGAIRLKEDEKLVISSDDLSEFYYTFVVSEQRASRNAIGIRFLGRELGHLQCYTEDLADIEVFICLSTLAMGDSLAVEIAQQSHFNLLRQKAGSMRSHEVLQYRKIIPRGPFYELLTIDDHIGLQKVLRNSFSTVVDTKRDIEVFAASEQAYLDVKLVAHPGKRQRRVAAATVLGAEIDGEAGMVSAPRSRIALLMFTTMLVVKKRTVTRRVLQSLLGCWIHACLFRRPVFSVMDCIFSEGIENSNPDCSFELSAMAVQELMMLVLLGPLLQADLRVDVASSLYMLDASPTGGAICHATLGEAACEELWRHSEQKGYYTSLQQGSGLVLRELGLEHSELFGPGDEFLEPPDPVVERKQTMAEPQQYEFDCIELFSGQGNWTTAHASVGLRMHPGIERNAVNLAYGDLLDDATFRETAMLADSGTVKEWHAGPPCWSFGTLRRPRLRSKSQPAGYDMHDPVTREQTLLAVRIAFIMILAVLRGCFISVEQPGSSVMFCLHIYRVLLALGCRITKFPFCGHGSGFMKPSKWLHNKPWLDGLSAQCVCKHKNAHFVVQGSFTHASIREFNKRCEPGVVEVYGRMPRPGEAVSSFSASYPIPLCEKMAAGSKAAHAGLWPDRASTLPGRTDDVRSWHDDPDWVQELCEGVQYRELFRYKFKKSGHINTLECRVYKSWLKHCSKRHPRSRVVGLLDSRVTMGAAAKGRSSSKSLSRILRTSLGYVLGGALYPGCIHCRSPWNKADAPSRDRPVEKQLRQFPKWLKQLQAGQTFEFDVVMKSSY